MYNQPTHLLRAFALCGLLCMAACSTSSDFTSETSYPNPDANDYAPYTAQNSAAPNPAQKVYATPEDAVNALVTATDNDDKPSLMRILGPQAEKIINSGDEVADDIGRNHFVDAYKADHRIDKVDANHAVLIVGDEQWPMPIPIAHSVNGWWFDSSAGEEEILNRRIGHDELNVLETCRIYVQAQREFAMMKLGSTGIKEYAQHFHSHGNKRDGLYWQAEESQESPLGPMIADATAEGYKGQALSSRTPYEGYYFKILKRQGSHAPSGAKNYIKNGKMTEGFALLAFPARYGDSGVMTFMVNRNGIVFEKNLGTETALIAPYITSFDPDSSWQVVE